MANRPKVVSDLGPLSDLGNLGDEGLVIVGAQREGQSKPRNQCLGASW